MREPPELTHLRVTLSRKDAAEAFRHLRGHEPKNDAQLEAFIEDYVREAYSDGVVDWTNSQRIGPVYRRSMDAPLGKKLREAGFESLWSYLDQRGFGELDQLRADLDCETLAPIGFWSFVLEVAQEDHSWLNAIRALATQALNSIRSSPKRDFIAFMAIHRIASDSPQDLKWIKAACADIVNAVQKDDAILASPVTWTDAWLVEIIRRNAIGHEPDRPRGGV